MTKRNYRYFLVACLLLLTSSLAYQPSSRPPRRATPAARVAAAAAVSILLTTAAVALPPVVPAMAVAAAAVSDAAAQISLNQLPPTSIRLQIGDLPVVGSYVSGTYTRVPDNSVANPSITIQSPKNKVKAISSLAQGGHLEFDVVGKLTTHFDVDIASDEAGVAKIVVQSNLVPKLPFKNRASTMIGQQQPTGGRESPWNTVTNLGSGETYYYNVKTGATQFDRPSKI